MKMRGKHMSNEWPILKRYPADKLTNIAMPIGGIGTGTISLGGRGDLRDWEVMNRPAKGFIPHSRARISPSIVLRTETDKGTVTRLVEGPIEEHQYHGNGCQIPNHGLPRFRNCSFETTYPCGRVCLQDDDVPLTVALESFNPLIPPDIERSGLPVAILRLRLQNSGNEPVNGSVCLSVPNFIGRDDAKRNANEYRAQDGLCGIAMRAEELDTTHEDWGTMAIATLTDRGVSHRTAWLDSAWGDSLLDFWDEFSSTGQLTDREQGKTSMPQASLAVEFTAEPGTETVVPFLITWHFPNRLTWSPATDGTRAIIGNAYTTRFDDAWAAAEHVAANLDELERDSIRFAKAFCSSDLPEVVKEAALFNLSTLRTQTCFRTADGHFYAFEGCGPQLGCCNGSCTHVWNYEVATAFLFGPLAREMREIEFAHATDEQGLMSFRVNLPLERAQEFGQAAADGQMGCIMKIYRDWQLSGDDEMLRRLWPKVKSALAFAWIPGGWDADLDGVMEGCQHNTMDVEYYGPNPQMQGWYLGALAAAVEMADYLNDGDFAANCRRLFEDGSSWMDEHLFNGEYYEHEIRLGLDVAQGLRYTMGAKDASEPDYQLGKGCLVDQLVGQYMARICGLPSIANEEKLKTTLKSLMTYNFLDSFHDHFNCNRSYVLGDEAGLLMAAYPGERPEKPFPYFTEAMTGFEYTAAVGMLYEGMQEEGLRCIQAIRDRYDGRRRNPFDEAECGHHYGRAMASWAALPALTGFQYSAVEGRMRFRASEEKACWFWSTGDAWGLFTQEPSDTGRTCRLEVLSGTVKLKQFELTGVGLVDGHDLSAGEVLSATLACPR